MDPSPPKDTADANMDPDSFDEQRCTGSKLPIAAAVIAGILLFIAGFAMTVASLPEDVAISADGSRSADVYDGGSSDRSDDGALLVIGLLLSMVGVTVATVVPAAAFIRHNRREA
ncbi:MAG: hypothetical protein JSU93_05045 [Methanobacteriota archaeon]|nr:MAG: hypothetical protein JSU93_05045 [Euryarchaeota archaeon]